MGQRQERRENDSGHRHVSRDRSPDPDRQRSAERPSSQRTERPSSQRTERSRDPKRRRSSSSPSRSKSRERDQRDTKHHRRRSRSHSTDSTHSDRRHKKDRHQHHRKRRSSRSRERRERKRERKDRKKKQGLSRTSDWGKYGVITEVDMFTKGPEFHTWLVEERKVNPETMSKDQNKKEFARFMEDYNTATLPHEKYYNMDAYQQRMQRMRAGEFLPPPEDAYDPAADLLAHQSKLKKRPVEHESYLSREQLLELRKVQHERVEAAKMKLLGMDVKTNMGVRMDGSMFEG